MKYSKEFIIKAHNGCTSNEGQIKTSTNAGCFYCKSVFLSKEITEWIDDEKNRTAICPKCGIDSVLSDEFPIHDMEFLKAMYYYWFQ